VRKRSKSITDTDVGRGAGGGALTAVALDDGAGWGIEALVVSLGRGCGLAAVSEPSVGSIGSWGTPPPAHEARRTTNASGAKHLTITALYTDVPRSPGGLNDVVIDVPNAVGLIESRIWAK
jgi:hypothetical protein